jgi:hypothetical protein
MGSLIGSHGSLIGSLIGLMVRRISVPEKSFVLARIPVRFGTPQINCGRSTFVSQVQMKSHFIFYGPKFAVL